MLFEFHYSYVDWQRAHNSTRKAEVLFYLTFERTALTWFIWFCLLLRINYEVSCFWIMNNFQLLKGKKSCFPMNFLLFLNSRDFEWGDFDLEHFGVGDFDFADFDM